MGQIDSNILEERLYLSAYFLWLTNAIINITIWNKIPIIDRLGGYLSGTAMVLLLIQFLIKKQYIWKDFLGIALIIGINILIGRIDTNSYIVYTVVFMYFSANIDYRKILKVTFGTQLLFMIFTVSVNLLKVRFNGAETLLSGGLGYGFMQYPAHILLFLTLMWGSIRKNISWFEGILFVFLNWIMYTEAEARTDLFLSIVAIVGFVYLSKVRSNRINKIYYGCVKYGIWPLAIGSIILQWVYREDIGWMCQLNKWLTDRLTLGSRAIQKYGFSFWGQKISWIGVGGREKHPELIYNYVDNVFLKEALSYGVIFLIMILIAVFLTESILLQRREYKLAWALFIMIGYGVINAHFDMVSYNPFILLLGILLRKNETDEPIGVTFLEGIINKLSHLNIYKHKHSIRVVLLRLYFAYLLILAMLDMGTVEQSYDVYVWISYIFITLISIFTYEVQGNKTRVKSRTRLEKWLILFCCLAVISDVIISKTFRYASIGMVAFGGMFVEAWKSMEHPDVFAEDIKRAIQSTVVLCGCIEIVMFCRNYNSVCDINTMILLAAVGIILGIENFKQNKLFSTAEMILAGFVIFRCDIRQIALLYHDYIKIIYRCLQNITMWGHRGWPKYSGVECRVNNSIIMNMYRYGLLSGMSYIGMGIACIRLILKRLRIHVKTYQMMVYVVILFSGLGLMIERPFISVGWMMFYYMIISLFILQADDG